ncbi:MAG TPA: hypothetical protein VKA68_14500, partial [bacterium]|nr:hypothetical protein [bacterium]
SSSAGRPSKQRRVGLTGCLVNADGDSVRVSRMREIRTSGSTRGKADGMYGMRLVSHNGETL